ncbi:hypothetical protein Taro_004025 [Colocasia esculenta]|uniref:Uncharacterized protein n=1 Tax=Colocasia esculenta TaxID=4460 RepID=A0A843TQJ5_COLES|nr:hypothetical protein [Colocasia esculenta]
MSRPERDTQGRRVREIAVSVDRGHVCHVSSAGLSSKGIATPSSARPGEVLCEGLRSTSTLEHRFVAFSPRGSRVEREERQFIVSLRFYIAGREIPPVVLRGIREITVLFGNVCNDAGHQCTLENTAHVMSVWLTCVTPSVVTTSVGSPRFRGEPGTWVCSGFVPVQWYHQGLAVFLDTLTLEESLEQQLDLSSVAARLRGRPVCLSGSVAGVASHATWPEFGVRECRRFPILLLVPSRTIAEQGLRHLQQCKFLGLYASGCFFIFLQTFVNGIPCEASARSRETELCQVRYQCGTVEVCVVFLDTLTLEFELYVRLRERRQWDSDL